MKKLARSLCVLTLLLAGLTGANAAHAATTFYNVTATSPEGYPWQIWLTAANGFAFCADQGFDTMTNFTGTCGEDESSYLEHDFYADTWYFVRSGSKNGCYPLFSSITCSYPLQ
jgi:hypothetical protein